MKAERITDLDQWLATSRHDGQALPQSVLTRWRWHQEGVIRNRMRYAITEVTAIGGAAAVPVAAAANLAPVITAALGAVVLIATAVRTTFQTHENWVEHSMVWYDIEREVALFMAEAPPYEGSRASQHLITRVEALAYESAQRWARRRYADQVRVQENLSSTDQAET